MTRRLRSPREARILALLLAPGAIGCSTGSGTLAPPAPDDVPVQIGLDSNGTPVRMYVDVRIGSAPSFRAVLDTGSSGLRVLANTVPDSAFADITNTVVTYGYGTYESAITLSGVVAMAAVTIDERTTENPIPVMLVQDSGCSQGASCRTLQEQFPSYAPAVLGVGMRASAADHGIGNPIAQFPGHPPFVIHLATSDSDASTSFLRIGALPTDALAFKTFQLSSYSGGVPLPDGTPVWNDWSVPTRVANETTGTNYTAPSPWDTGDPSSYVAWPQQQAPYTTEFTLGTVVKVSIGPPDAPMGDYALVVGPSPSAAVDALSIIPTLGAAYINLGDALFLHYDALFDQERGVMGLALH